MVEQLLSCRPSDILEHSDGALIYGVEGRDDVHEVMDVWSGSVRRRLAVFDVEREGLVMFDVEGQRWLCPVLKNAVGIRGVNWMAELQACRSWQGCVEWCWRSGHGRRRARGVAVLQRSGGSAECS